jgi:hypothetical protein
VTGEIKWCYFAPQKSDTIHSLSHLNVENKDALRAGIYHLISKFKSIRLICTVVDIKAAYQLPFVHGENDLYGYAYKQLIERFQYYLRDLSRTIGSKINGIIVCDHRQPKDDDQLRTLHQSLLTGSKKHSSLYQHLIEGVFISPSHFSVGIQFADMVGGAVYRKFVRNDDRYFEMIKSSFRQSPKGKIEGYGLIRWPKH